MATYSSSQAYVSTTKYSRDTAGLISPQTSIIYTVPANREAEVEFQYLRILGGGGNTTRISILYTGTSNESILLYSINSVAIFGFSPNNPPSAGGGDVFTATHPYKTRLVSGDVIRFVIAGGASNSVGIQYEILVKEFVKV
jgi:hypothetical protein